MDITLPRRMSFDVYQNNFRRERMKVFMALVDKVIAARGSCRILDLGGVNKYWQGLEPVWRGRKLDITLVNNDNHEHILNSSSVFSHLFGDVRDLGRIESRSFDVVHSNSVIEHVGTWEDMKKMAAEARRLAPSYFIQTPNYWFPYEPHFRMPVLHWLPRPMQVALVMAKGRGFFPKAETVDAAHGMLASCSLIDARSMQALFPDAEIRREAFGPLTKSLMAVK